MQFWKHFRLALRRMARQKGVSLLAVLSLGLGIASNAAVLSSAYPVLMLRLPFPGADRLATVLCSWGGRETVLSDAEVIYLRQGSTAFTDLAVRSPWKAPLSAGGIRRPASALRVSSNYLRTLGVQPALGAGFAQGGDGGPQTAVLSHQLWQTRFGGDPGILGRPIQLGEQSYAVAGVMPPSVIDQQTEIWVEAPLDPHSLRGRWPVLARLREGVTPAQAQREAEHLHQQYLAEHQSGYEGHLTVTALRDALLDGSPWFGGQPLRPRIYALLGLLGFLLLMGCANVANLLMIGAHARRREIAVRRALGAGRGRIAAQLLSEGLAFALTAGVAGLLLALSAGGLVRSFGQGLSPLPQAGPAQPLWLGFGIGLTVLCGLLGGLAPALTATRFAKRGWGPASGETADRFTLRAAGRFSRAFIFVQVAVCVILLSGAAVTVKSISGLYRVDFGFAPADILKVDISLPPGKYSDPDADKEGTSGREWRFYTIRAEMELHLQQAAENLSRIAGVQDVAATGRFQNEGCMSWFVLAGQPPFNSADQAPLDSPQAQSGCLRPISGDYFEALQIPLQRGRRFRPEDSASSPPAAIINQAMARRFWPGEDPIGQQIEVVFDSLRQPASRQWREIVGLVGDTRHSRMERTPPRMIYIPRSQLPAGPQMRLASRFMHTFLLRHAPGRLPQTEEIAAAIGTLDPDAALLKVEPLRAALDGPFDQTLFYTRLLAMLAVMGLLLAAAGIYGVTAFAVRLRSGEISLRKAVGARLWDVLRLVAGQNLSTILVGLAAGLVVASASAQTLSSLLYGVEAEDFWAFSIAAVFILALALLASLLPARRAYQINPADLLRFQ